MTTRTHYLLNDSLVVGSGSLTRSCPGACVYQLIVDLFSSLPWENSKLFSCYIQLFLLCDLHFVCLFD